RAFLRMAGESGSFGFTAGSARSAFRVALMSLSDASGLEEEEEDEGAGSVLFGLVAGSPFVESPLAGVASGPAALGSASGFFVGAGASSMEVTASFASVVCPPCVVLI